jgi:hypothetical protein
MNQAGNKGREAKDEKKILAPIGAMIGLER